jgi:hypothetical protein
MTDAPSGLSTAVWTDADFPVMGWHDCRIHAVSVAEYEDDTLPPTRLLLDLDYIVRWVDPAPRRKYFTFWIAPATLVFEQVWDVTGEIGPLHGASRSRTSTASPRRTTSRTLPGTSRATSSS